MIDSNVITLKLIRPELATFSSHSLFGQNRTDAIFQQSDVQNNFEYFFSHKAGIFFTSKTPVFELLKQVQLVFSC